MNVMIRKVFYKGFKGTTVWAVLALGRDFFKHCCGLETYKIRYLEASRSGLGLF